MKSIKVLLIACFLTVFSVQAARDEKSKATGAIDAQTFEKLMKAQELTEAGNHDEALGVLDGIKNRGKVEGYGKAQMWNFYAFIYASKEDYANAIKAYKEVIAIEETPDQLVLQAKYTIAQLYFQLEDYDSCIKYMNEWLKGVEKPTPTAHIMLAQAHYQKRNFDLALSNVDKAIELEKAAGRQVKENWLRLKSALYYDKGDYPNTAKTYEDLVKYYPKVDYLKQLAGMYGEMGKDMRRLTVFDSIYLNNSLKKENEILNLAYMFLGAEVPYKAAKIIEKGMNDGIIQKTQKNIETLGNAWAQANQHDKAIPVLEEAARLSESGKLFARLAGVYFDAGDYKKAAEAAKKAAEKGGLKNPGNNYLLMGMSYSNLKQHHNALQAFRQAKETKSILKDARAWEKHTLQEIKLIEDLEKSQFELEEKTKKTLESEENNKEI
ncbi:MAG: tetratricopeptide repeat protein [Gammaproteobacteria bacterium]|nr:tetratricopeptide repeat protein [Xanthomonadales bacterium]MCB1593276.1 tetratricopeptide repeat protein [Xanthomonadales bacterium]MCB1603058.1 tetratricopeptide repeat protein [Xanthomonadales bacterium]HOP22760.1 tetratricopeptide repeat protein [Gammaproteobacteria bacterium]